MNDLMNCGHPVECLSKMLPDFIGDTPATQRIGTVHCCWCADVARAEGEREEAYLERDAARKERDEARKALVILANEENAKTGGDSGGERVRAAIDDAVRAAEGGRDE
jgi:hypothetical protein